MKNKKISELNVHLSPQPSDVFAVVNGGETKRIATGTFLDYGNGYNKSHAVFYHTGSVSGSANTEYFFPHSSVALQTDVDIVDQNKIIVTQAGVYKLTFTMQVIHTSGGSATISVWLKKNGNNIPDSTTDLYVAGNQVPYLFAMDYIVDLQAGDFIQIAWSDTDGAVTFPYIGTRSNPVRPAVPSIITNINRIG
jgi:hypothetical protein